MLLGCLLVVAVLVVFLFDWRTALISITAIPLSLIAAALVLHYWGTTFNTMVVAGLVIALGEVVDDAIIDVENIQRRLRQNALLPQPAPAFDVVLAASLEVRSAVVYASLIVTLVFVPILFLDGVAGSFFRPLAVAYILAILASLGVALTLTPALSLLLLPAVAGRKREEAPLSRYLQHAYVNMLPPLVARPAHLRGRDRRHIRGHRDRRGAPGRGIPAEFSRDRFPDALGRKAGGLARCHAPRHDPGQPRIARAFPACAISARTSAAPKWPTKSWAPTSPSCGSASSRTSI